MVGDFANRRKPETGGGPFESVNPTENLGGELTTALAGDTCGAQLLKVCIKPLDDFVRIIEKKALLVSHR